MAAIRDPMAREPMERTANPALQAALDQQLEFLRGHFRADPEVESPKPSTTDLKDDNDGEDEQDEFGYVDSSASEDEQPTVVNADQVLQQPSDQISSANAMDSGAGVAPLPPSAPVSAETAAAEANLAATVGLSNRQQRKRARAGRRRVGQESDVLYDANADEEDEEWWHALRKRHLPQSLWNRKTDAVLCCPCCFGIVCLDCQRHEQFINQFRAMFVMNCNTVTTECMRFKNSDRQVNQGIREFYNASTAQCGPDEELLFPILCAQCGTEVALQDKDEVFHFYNVIPEDPS
eukprot:TRINITY_DN14692_c0_g1_i1.p1 TRINITY_DN14692_c0_g1~~TRINITY_DN14692_c0_g1_i1.p1  ORF type:complete len:313 (+),score=70.47 TRINITY_DN14692_c0_g1_i1:66-941(+)